MKLLERIELACEEQLAVTFENYYSLTESAPYGLADNGAPSPEQPAPALRPAVGLCSEHLRPFVLLPMNALRDTLDAFSCSRTAYATEPNADAATDVRTR